MHHTPPLLHLIDTLLGRVPDVTIRRGIPAVGIAEVNFAARVITLAHNLTRGELHTALAHEIIHLLRGPADVRFVAEEEYRVHAEVARLLAPRHQLPAILDRANPRQVAHDLVIDTHTASLAISLARDDTEVVA